VCRFLLFDFISGALKFYTQNELMCVCVLNRNYNRIPQQDRSERRYMYLGTYVL